MQMIADFLLAVGALGAATYCMILSRRLRQLNRLEDGMGGAIAVLSLQVDELKRALDQAQATAAAAEQRLTHLTREAEAAGERLAAAQYQHVDDERRATRVVRKRHAGLDQIVEGYHG
ncbi:hypothetical protein ACEYYA_04910 [Paracoccus sp. p3-h83]|uniref:hypothetical protein n=1 Tax=Paracoccus sp. p3-h83 TaxID=3342805 RepID=UPI0035B87747